MQIQDQNQYPEEGPKGSFFYDRDSFRTFLGLLEDAARPPRRHDQESTLRYNLYDLSSAFAVSHNDIIRDGTALIKLARADMHEPLPLEAGPALGLIGKGFENDIPEVEWKDYSNLQNFSLSFKQHSADIGRVSSRTKPPAFTWQAKIFRQGGGGDVLELQVGRDGKSIRGLYASFDSQLARTGIRHIPVSRASTVDALTQLLLQPAVQHEIGDIYTRKHKAEDTLKQFLLSPTFTSQGYRYNKDWELVPFTRTVPLTPNTLKYSEELEKYEKMVQRIGFVSLSLLRTVRDSDYSAKRGEPLTRRARLSGWLRLLLR